MSRQVPELSCPICGYDCHAVDSASCSECGAMLSRSITSPNMLNLGPWQLRLLICASALLLVAIVLGTMSADVSRQRMKRQFDLVQQNMSDLQDYRWQNIQWWNDLQSGKHPGLAPAAPTLVTAADEYPRSELWLAATVHAGPQLFLLAMASLIALLILWMSVIQQRRPSPVSTVRLVSGMVYLYAAIALLIASIAVGEFLV